MKTKLIRNFLLIFVIIAILLASILGLFMTTEPKSLGVDVNNQNILTDSPNVTFDAYFKDSSDNVVHSIVADVNPEYPYLYVDIGLTEGTLINPTLQFLDLSNTTDINYDLPFSNMTENVQSVDSSNP